MDRIKHFLAALCIAGCGGGGGGTGGTDTPDAHPADGTTGAQDGSNGSGSGGSGSGGNGQVTGGDRCADATSISLATMHVDLTANPSGSNADLAAPCGVSGTPDVFFKFFLTTRELVYADTFGSSSNTTLFFADSCGAALTDSTTPGDAVCSGGACGTGQSQIVALLNPGLHYLVLAGTGAATIHFRHAESGVGTLQTLPQGSNTLTGTTTSGSGALYACEAGGMENTYWWMTCPGDTGGDLHASTCAVGTTFDTVLSFQMAGSDAVACNDDDSSCGVQTRSTLSATLPAGADLYVLAVDGLSQARHGNYTLTVSRP